MLVGLRAVRVWYAAHVVAVASVAMVLVWCIYFLHGLAWNSSDKSLLFNEEEALSSLNKSLYEGLDEACNIMKEVEDISLVRFADVLFTERMKVQLREWSDRLMQDRKQDFHLKSNQI